MNATIILRDVRFLEFNGTELSSRYKTAPISKVFVQVRHRPLDRVVVASPSDFITQIIQTPIVNS